MAHVIDIPDAKRKDEIILSAESQTIDDLTPERPKTPIQEMTETFLERVYQGQQGNLPTVLSNTTEPAKPKISEENEIEPETELVKLSSFI